MKQIIKWVAVFVILLIALPSSCFAFTSLSKGSKGNEVKELQNKLNELGYSVGVADGDFGSKTENALCQLQKDIGLQVTGILDEATYNVLFNDVTMGKMVDSDSSPNDVIVKENLDSNSNTLFTVVTAEELEKEDAIVENYVENGPLFLIQGEDGYGYCNEEGEVIIPCQWGWADQFIDGLAAVSKTEGGKIGIINKSGKLIVPYEWTKVAYQKYGYVVMTDWSNSFSHMAAFNSYGEEIIPQAHFVRMGIGPEGIAYSSLEDNGVYFYDYATGETTHYFGEADIEYRLGKR